MADAFQVRRVGPGDAQLFLEVMLTCWRGTVPENSTAYRETPETLSRALEGDAAGFLLWRGETAVGCGRYVVVPGPAGSSVTWVEMKRIGVIRELRKQGLGALVHDALEQRARSQGHGGAQLAVRSDQPRLVTFWQGLGYRAATDVTLTTENLLTPPPFYMRKSYARST